MPAFYRNRVGLSLPIAIAVLFATFAQPSNAQQIDALVDEVSVANIEAHLEALTVGIGPRSTRATRAEAANYIAGQLESFGYAVTRAPVLSSENVISKLTGTVDPAKTLVIGAHFDSVAGSPGADDNASGVAGFLEIARVLSNTLPAYSIEFVGFALEESPGVAIPGSGAYVTEATAQGRDLLGVLNLEMIGYASTQDDSQFAFSDIPECMVFSEQGLTVGDYIAAAGNDDSASLVHAFQQAAAQYVPELHVLTGTVAGNGECFSRVRDSDHSSFWDAGYQALMLTDTSNFRNPNYHLPSDTIDTLDLAFARNVTQATLATALVIMSVPGDFTADRALTVEDIDLLTAEIDSPDPRLWFDLNDDGNVDHEDRSVWVSDLKQTSFGDADLDGQVNFSDFLLLADSFSKSGGWAMGDFDGNGDVDFADFLALSDNFGASNASVADVPEPSCLTLALIGMAGSLGLRQSPVRLVRESIPHVTPKRTLPIGS